MKTFAVSQFKAHALAILDAVAQTGESVVVTKRGKPLARVVPYAEPAREMRPGRLEGTLLFERDLGAPGTGSRDDGGGASDASPRTRPSRPAKRGRK